MQLKLLRERGMYTMVAWFGRISVGPVHRLVA